MSGTQNQIYNGKVMRSRGDEGKGGQMGTASVFLVSIFPRLLHEKLLKKRRK
jgi:hypothetical protein